MADRAVGGSIRWREGEGAIYFLMQSMPACRFLRPGMAHRRQGNSVDLHSFPFRAQHGAAPAVSFLHEVASAPTFVAAMGIEQLLSGQREIDAHVAQHQYQKVALHGLSYFEQAQGGPPPGVLAHPPPLPEADLEQSDKDQLGIDQSLDLALGARRHFGQCKITLPRLEDRFDAPAQTIDLSYGLGWPAARRDVGDIDRPAQQRQALGTGWGTTIPVLPRLAAAFGGHWGGHSHGHYAYQQLLFSQTELAFEVSRAASQAAQQVHRCAAVGFPETDPNSQAAQEKRVG